MSFKISFESKSSLTFSIKKSIKDNPTLGRYLGAFLLKIILTGLIVVLVANFSVLIAVILSLISLKIIVPKYWKKYRRLHSEGVLTYEIEDVVDFVAFEKQIYQDERGKRLIRHNFVLGQNMEELFYVFLPPVLYNSDKFRYYIRYFTQVIYPIFVIILPLCIGITVMFAKNTKMIFKALRKDKFVRIILFLADESAEFIEDQANDYKLTRIIWNFFDDRFDQLGDLIEVVFKWLRMEVLLIFMQIEYFNHCYISVWKTIVKTFKFWGNFLRNHGLGWLISPIEKGVKTIKRTVNIKEIKETYEKTEELKEQVEQVEENSNKKNN